MKTFKFLLVAVSAVLLMGCSKTPQQETKTDDGKNAVIETIMTRRSVRKYQPQAVNRDTMQTIVECGINAPNAHHQKEYHTRREPSLCHSAMRKGWHPGKARHFQEPKDVRRR